MSLDSLADRVQELYEASASYVLGAQGYRLWLESLADFASSAWPMLLAIGAVVLVYAAHTAWRTRRLRHLARSRALRERPGMLFHANRLSSRRMPLVFEPSGHSRRREDGRWR